MTATDLRVLTAQLAETMASGSPEAMASLLDERLAREHCHEFLRCEGCGRLVDCKPDCPYAAWLAYEEARGELAGCPETLPCYDCGRAARDCGGLHHTDDSGFPYMTQKVVALGRVVNRADPTQTYKLECGHVAL